MCQIIPSPPPVPGTHRCPAGGSSRCSWAQKGHMSCRGARRHCQWCDLPTCRVVLKITGLPIHSVFVQRGLNIMPQPASSPACRRVRVLPRRLPFLLLRIKTWLHFGCSVYLYPFSQAPPDTPSLLSTLAPNPWPTILSVLHCVSRSVMSDSLQPHGQ